MTTDEMIEVMARAHMSSAAYSGFWSEDDHKVMARAALAAILPVIREEVASSDWLWTDGYQWVRVDLIRARFDQIAKEIEG